MDLWSIPEILVIHLKRFEGGADARKIDTPVTFPDEIDMSRYVVGPHTDRDLNYRLYGVSEHSGVIHGGHYTACAVVNEDSAEHWYDFNDSSCTQSTPEDAHSDLAYILFYARVGEGDVWVPGETEPVPVEQLNEGDP
jgi:ubiquitin C-terminal hydrolase